VNPPLALVEAGGWSPAMIILDRMEKTASVVVLQAELNDGPGVCLKLTGSLADLEAAAGAAKQAAKAMEIPIVIHVMAAPAEASRAAYQANAEFNPLIEQKAVLTPLRAAETDEDKMNEQANFAIGMIETQGFTAVFEAIDTAVKAANVEVIAREKLGGGYITVVIKGDVAAVQAAVEAGSAKVSALGRLIAAHVIPRPSQAVLSLLPPLAAGAKS
jgi:carbon dioxide concentrating mechanism protein CcmO